MGAETIFIILIVLLVLHAFFRPHLDETSEGDIILWYYTGRTTRDYIMIWRNK